MKRVSWLRWAAGCGAIAAAGLLSGVIARADEPNGTQTIVIRFGGADQGNAAAAAPTPQSQTRYWLGVECRLVDDTLRTQLDLPNDQGLAVEQVMPGSPAAKAEIKPHDVLLSAGDKPLAQVADLAAAVEATKDKEMSIKLLRGGKPLTVNAKPEEHNFQPQGDALNLPPGADREAVERWLKQFGGTTGPQPFEFKIIRPGPGVMLPPNVSSKTELPDDLSIDIHREGKQPARITVKKGDQKWEVSEGDLAKLPDDVRRFVEPLLSGGPVRIDLPQINLQSGQTAIAGAAPGVQSPEGDELARRLEQRIDDLTKRIDEMQTAIKELREQHKSGQ